MSAELDRVLAFEVGGRLFAIAVEDVLEVGELEERSLVPTVPLALAGVCTHRGDALPVVDARVVFGFPADASLAPAQLLVLGRSSDEPGTLGIAVDRILGLAPAPRPARNASDAPRTRATLDGRMLRVLDAGRLVETAREAVARSVRGES